MTNEQSTKKQFAEPEGEFFFGNARLAMKSPLEYYEQCFKKYGDYIKFSAFAGPAKLNWYLLMHPTAVEAVLQKHQQKYRKPDLFNKPAGLLVGQGILTSEGSFWLQHRRLAQPAFHRNEIVRLGDTIVACAKEVVERWSKLADGTIIDVHKEMILFSLKTAGLALFSMNLEADAGSFGDNLRKAFEFVNQQMYHYPLNPPLWVPLKENIEFKKAKEQLDAVVLSVIEHRRTEGGDHHDFLGLLMAARDEDTGEGMNDQQLKDEVITLLVAGHDTIAAALSWTWFLLAQNPDCRDKLHDELKQTLNGIDPSVSSLEKLSYTKMTLDESLRLYPPAWGQPRQAIEDDEIDGYFIPKGAIIDLMQWNTHRHPDFWDEPEKFEPERFLPEVAAKRPKFAYYPFGGGSRVCIGQHLALLEGQLALATIAQSFQLELVPGEVVEPDPTFTLIPKGGLKMKLVHRN